MSVIKEIESRAGEDVWKLEAFCPIDAKVGLMLPHMF
jgi:hypothetical protein